ncbi:MAG: purine-nucleoside phosphorylase [Campylobacterales bacterium]|nr:purine-nucleoside phosphorylase [Campylobacterales bacterium]
MIICAGNQESFSFATTIGVGLIDSAINLTKICLMQVPEYLIFIGSCGSYGKLKPFDIVTSSTSSNIELSFLQDLSYTPIDNVVKAQNSISSFFVSHETIINSSNYITTDEKLSKQMLDYNIDCENMEFFSVVKVAREFNIPVVGVFVVTNYCNKNAHEDFKQNHSKAMQILVNFLHEKSIIK